MTSPDSDAIRCTVSINYRDTVVSVARHNEILWNSRIQGGAVDWIISIIDYFRNSHHVLIGRLTAENILVLFGTAEKLESPMIQTVRGRSLDTGLPHAVEINSNQLFEAFRGHLSHLVFQVSSIITGPERSETGASYQPYRIPSELKRMIENQPVLLGGEFGTLYGLDHVLQTALNMTVITSNESDR